MRSSSSRLSVAHRGLSRAIVRSIWMRQLIVALACMLLPSACDGAGGAVTLTSLREDLFQPRCSASVCHGSFNPQRGLDLESDPFGTLVNVASVEDPSMMRVAPGDPEHSLLFLLLQGSIGGTERMPPGVTLPDEEIESVRRWIANGAAND